MSSSPSAAGDREDSTTMYSWGSIQGWTRIQIPNRSCHERIYAFVCEYNIQWYNTTSHFSYFLWVRSFTAISVVLMFAPLLCFLLHVLILYFFSLEVVVFYLLALQFVLLLLLLLCLCLVYWKLLAASEWAKFSTSGETQMHFLNWHVRHTCIHDCTEHNTDLKTIGLGVELYDPPLYTKTFLKGILQLWMQIIMQNILMHRTFKWM